MNKLYKCALGLLTTFILSFTCFSNADNVESLVSYNEQSFNIGTTWTSILSSNDFTAKTVCLAFDGNYDQINIGFRGTDSGEPWNKFYFTSNDFGRYVCLLGNNYLRAACNNGTCQGTVKYFVLDILMTTNLPIMTSLECQQQYSLIPISEVTANYCALNFGMIDPQECPINSGTGAIVRSNLMINDIPYAQNQNINVFIPDFLAWNITFNDLYTVIEVEGYDADEEYIENVINNEKLTPTNEDFANMLTGITAFIPYLFIGLLFFRFVRIVNKIWK